MKKKLFVSLLSLSLLIVPFSTMAYWSYDNYGLPDSSIYEIVQNILYWLLGILGIVGIIGFVVSGIMYLISSGDDDLMSRAKNAMIYSIIGIVVGLVGFIVIKAVETMLNASGSRF